MLKRLLFPVLAGIALLSLLGPSAYAGPDTPRKQRPTLQATMPADLKLAFENARYAIEKGRAQNDANGFSVQFSGAETRIELPGGAQAAFTVSGYGWGSALKPAGPVTQVQAIGKRLDRQYGAGLAEWFLNTPQGLEQGFVLSERAKPATGPLHIQLDVRQPAANGEWSLRSASDHVLLTQAGTTLDYAGLKAYDATGAIIPSRMHASGSHIELEVDDARAIYPLTIDPALTQQAVLTASDAANLALFGVSVALSSDGNTALVGAYSGDNFVGSAYVFTRSGATWSQQQELAGAGGGFGDSVALSGDGNTALVGAPSANNEGAAYVYTRSGSTWSLQQELAASDASATAQFGYSVALSSNGSTALVGESQSPAKGVLSGAAYVFTRSGTTWSQQAELTASDGAAYDVFGFSVALSGDGITALVGEQMTPGAAYVFTSSSGSWSQQKELTAPVATTGDYFGTSVALSGDGSTALVGVPNYSGNDGEAYVFKRLVTTWSQQAELTASDGAGDDQFGLSVALSSDGSTALVGADYKNSQLGAAYTFTVSGVTWTQQQELTASDGVAGDKFGWSAALSSDGSTALVGAPYKNDDTGEAYAFAPPAVTPCLAGSYSATGDTPCISAPAGSYVGTPGAMAATLCGLGTYSNVAGSTACTNAPAGSYVGMTGAMGATLCGLGTYSNVAGSSSCTSAPTGSYVGMTGATGATLCGLGTYSNVVGSTACTNAPAGSYVGMTGATGATLCGLGTYSNVAGSSSCTSAPTGSYVGMTGATGATLCAIGTYSSMVGQSACTKAPAGSYVSGIGASAATPCAAGTFTSSIGNTACTKAPAGSYVGMIGSTGATLCSAGTYSSMQGQSACTNAPAGSYVSATGAKTSTPCAAGSYQPTAGQASCLLAGDGYYVTKSDQATETACPTGDTTLATGSTSASACIPIYKFNGFLIPDVNPPKINTGIAGLPFPLVWQLRSDTNAIVSTLSAVTSVTYKATSCTPCTTSPAGALTANSDGPLVFIPVLNVYEFTWATPKTPGCYTVFLTLQGGQVFTADFNLKSK